MMKKNFFKVLLLQIKERNYDKINKIKYNEFFRLGKNLFLTI